MNKQEIAQYCQRLVDLLVAREALHTQRVKDAFLAVPRHGFISSYYQDERPYNGWVLQNYTETTAWYDYIYSNVYLITRINQENLPVSSSSQPEVMAAMLEYLDIQAGMRVLEIGTGTGYNASLLAHLAGDPHLVTTIDIDPEIITQASICIEKTAGSGMNIILSDGVQGYAINAPFDRIIATASTPTVPEQWYQQLAPGGILICILQPAHAGIGGILKASKDPDTHKLQGKIMSPAAFMPVHQGSMQMNYPRKYSVQPLHAVFTVDTQWFDPTMLWGSDFRFYIYSLLPDLTIMHIKPKDKERVVTVVSTDTQLKSFVTFEKQDQDYLVELRGISARAEWNRLVRAYSYWVTLGKPGIQDYDFEMDEYGQNLLLRKSSGIFWPFA